MNSFLTRAIVSGHGLRVAHRRVAHRPISTGDAKKLLGLEADRQPTIPMLRKAYFEAAKQTHPDVAGDADDFRLVTEAYERLLPKSKATSTEWEISQQEEDDYRAACLSVLGIPADIVEESKKNPMFRHWLGGNTDGAQHWRAFFSVHGGLAQKLKAPTAYLEANRNASQPSYETRPRRRRR